MVGRTNPAEGRALSSPETIPHLDAHTHLRETDPSERLADYLTKTGLHLIVSAARRETYKVFEHPQIAYSFGIHPWGASQKAVEAARDLLTTVPIIGEIGMDSVWTDTDPAVQEAVFRAQLDIAAEHGRLVVLHTKGEERRISRIMEDYDVPYMIHWYAGPPDLPLVKKARFVTLGPEPGELVKALSPEQILLETDGLASLEWLDGRKRSLRDWLPALERSFTMLCDASPWDRARLRDQLSRNNAALWQAARTKPTSS